LVAAWTKDWQEVANQIDAIDSEPNGLSLVPNPVNIINKSNLSTSETLWKLTFSQERGGGEGHRYSSQMVSQIASENMTWKVINGVPTQYNEENLGRNDGRAFPNSYLMSLYPEDDLRITAYYKTHYTYQNPNELITIPPAKDKVVNGVTIRSTTNETGLPYTVKVGDTIYGRDVKEAKGKALDRRRILPSSLKNVDIWTKPLDANNDHVSFKDIMVFRLAESYLLGAEAYMHLGNQVKARYYYNKTWERAGHSPETKEITFDMIRDEHARELAFEGRRWEFLKRNGIWYNQMRNYAGDFTKYPASSLADYDENTYGISDGRDPAFGPNPEYYYDMNGSDTDIFVRFNVRSYHVNWPIPQSQIDAMGAENFPQNPGYSE
ncbi:MAG: RagB/SusD family nutrient uptake outer membrane protein, partial [Fermentimonas sp.]|nr:RagB/SusD family nutrient uptake outer membrane protein [Fermentimonas sp.]